MTGASARNAYAGLHLDAPCADAIEAIESIVAIRTWAVKPSGAGDVRITD
jgi:hypothetical protein